MSISRWMDKKALVLYTVEYCCCVASVVSDSVRPHRQQPTRLRCLWDSPGKNTGVGCHFLLQCMKVKSESEATQSCLTLSDLMDCSLPGSSIHGIFQARVLEWGAIALRTLQISYLSNSCNNDLVSSPELHWQPLDILQFKAKECSKRKKYNFWYFWEKVDSCKQYC